MPLCVCANSKNSLKSGVDQSKLTNKLDLFTMNIPSLTKNSYKQLMEINMPLWMFLLTTLGAGTLLLLWKKKSGDTPKTKIIRMIWASSFLLLFAASIIGIFRIMTESHPADNIPLEELISQADGGNIKAQHDLMYRYMEGKNAPKDAGSAWMWLYITAMEGNQDSQKTLDFLEKNRTDPEDIKLLQVSKNKATLWIRQHKK